MAGYRGDGSSSSRDSENISMESLIGHGVSTPFDDEQRDLRNRTHPRLQFSNSSTDIVSDLPSRNHAGNRVFSTLHHRRGDDVSPSETHVSQIVREMEKDEAFMEDNPISEQRRMETLREMPESLTMKRSIKKKLLRSVSSKSNKRPISLWKNIKYRGSMSWTKLNVTLKNFLSNCELWYSSMKVIEGHFGSSVATYFRFLRFIFLLNCLMLFLSFAFIVIPQLLYRFYESLPPGLCDGDIEIWYNDTDTDTTEGIIIVRDLENVTDTFFPTLRADPYNLNKEFTAGDIFTGEGFFTNTSLYYGYYTNETIRLTCLLKYSMPHAYFFTKVVCYFIIFISLSVSMAKSYRRSFIETSGGMKNVYALKIFCGWDYSIATEEAANLRSKTVYFELKELLGDGPDRRYNGSCISWLYMFSVRASLNILSLILIGGTGALTWYLMTRTESNEIGNVLDANRVTNFEKSMLMPLVVNIVMVISPFVFSWIVRLEDYSSPRTSLFIILLRTFLLEIVTVGVLVVFWLKRSQLHCWETSLGQEVYRLILMDFFIAIIGSTLVEFFHALIYKKLWKGIGPPTFDVAHNTLNLIYNQTLFFMGFYFSPLLSVIVVIKTFLMFYIRKISALMNCQPSHRSWRAAQTHTLFLGLSFLSLMGVLIAYGYIITRVEVSTCGPFTGYQYMYEMILKGLLNLKERNGFWLFIMYLTKPGVIAGILLAMLVCVYYLRAKAHAHSKMVTILREMLRTEGKDKEFLLSYYSRIAEEDWLLSSKHYSPHSLSSGDVYESPTNGEYKVHSSSPLRYSSTSLSGGRVQVHHRNAQSSNLYRAPSFEPRARKDNTSLPHSSSSEGFSRHIDPGTSFHDSYKNMPNRVKKNVKI